MCYNSIGDFMKLLIDADACPVVNEAIMICHENNIPCILFCDTAHQMQKEYAETVIADKGADSVDFALVHRVNPGDIVVTQDYGLAAICLAKKAIVLHQDGWQYSNDNIDALLWSRHETKKYRMAGGRTKGPRKRTSSQNAAFCDALQAILQNSKPSQG